MKKFERVLKGLECCKTGPSDCEDKECPYEPDLMHCIEHLCADALELLNEREAHSVCTKERCPMNANTITEDCNVKTCPWRTEALTPKVSISGLWYECPVCGRYLTEDVDHYCGRCGRKVKWE